MWDLGFSGRVYLVTGGTSGIGRAVAAQVAAEGGRVGIVARRTDRLETTVSSLTGADHVGISWDLSKPDTLEALAEEVSTRLGRIDGIVHAAGRYQANPLRTTGASTAQELFALNFFAPLLLTKALVQKTRRGKSMSVVFLGSVASHRGQPGASSYSASKGALNALVSSLVAELSREEIRFNTVVAGLVDTELSEGLRNSLGEKAWNNLIGQHPLGLGRAEDVANAAVFLLSEKSQWMTGTQLVIDGGYLAC
jgi:3-oxoacyl-[acyl-carrier protein] reductase